MASIREHSNGGKCKAMVASPGAMEVITKANTETTANMAKESMFQVMGSNSREPGKMATDRAKGCLPRRSACRPLGTGIMGTIRADCVDFAGYGGLLK